MASCIYGKVVLGWPKHQLLLAQFHADGCDRDYICYVYTFVLVPQIIRQNYKI